MGRKSKLKTQSAAPPAPFRPKVFVLMPFSKEFMDVYELGIKDVCLASGATCSRVDEQVFNDLIIDRVYSEIKSADIIVADMTGRNPNVFYEVGYAHALKKKVVLITSNIDDIPFDLRMHRHIVYNRSIRTIKERLAAELAVILPSTLPTTDFSLHGLDVVFFQHRKDQTCDDIDQTNGGLWNQEPALLIPNSVIFSPAELSNYGRGMFFDCLLGVRNSAGKPIDISGCSYYLTFPKDVQLSDESLRSGDGRHAKQGEDGRLTLSSKFSSKNLGPDVVEKIFFSLRSTLAVDGHYAIDIPVFLTINQYLSDNSYYNFTIHLSPISRMN